MYSAIGAMIDNIKYIILNLYFGFIISLLFGLIVVWIEYDVSYFFGFIMVLPKILFINLVSVSIYLTIRRISANHKLQILFIFISNLISGVIYFIPDIITRSPVFEDLVSQNFGFTIFFILNVGFQCFIYIRELRLLNATE
ncbi:MAG: hypothetical protein H6607_06210 [Flavobacteriales bacterium]|nr:hypothetical protein [Flavobacteriales bacterium]